MKLIIIGRGPSCLRCTTDFVAQHDLIVVINRFLYKGYEKYIGNKADIQFRVRSTGNFTSKEVKELGLKEVIFTNKNGYSGVPPYYKSSGVKVVYPSPPLRKEMEKRGYKFQPPSGVVALWYLLERFSPEVVSLVGLDFYEIGQPPYYFKEKEVDRTIKKYYRNKYRGNKVNIETRHDPKETIEFVKKIVLENPNIKFNFMTNSTRFAGFKASNLSFL